VKKKKLTIATLKGRVTFPVDVDEGERLIRVDSRTRAAVEAALFTFRKQYDSDPERYLEDVRVLLLTLQGVKASKIRADPGVEHKLKNARAFRQHLKRLRERFDEPLSQDRTNSFIEANWDELTTIPNPHRLPGLRAWWPSAAVELMKRVGVLPRTGYEEVHNADWFKHRRKRLKLTPAPRYRIKLGRSSRELLVSKKGV
jgi:hypothetical protein